MPVISPEQFIQIADRLAANYELLIQAEKRFMAPPNLASYQTGQSYQARLLLDLTGTGTLALFQANGTGTSGNSIYFSIVLPSTPLATLSSQCAGTNLVLSLATDADGRSNTLVEDAIAFMLNSTDFMNYVSLIYPVSKTGGIVQPYSMTALSGGVGASEGGLPLFTIMVSRPGPQGSFYTLTVNQPTSNNQTFNIFYTGYDLVVTLPTDGSGNPTETIGQFKTDLEAATSDFLVITSAPDTMMPAIPITTFSGGGIGSYAQIVLTPPPGSTAADPDVANGILKPAQILDENFTARNLEQGIAYLSNLQGALANHFLTVGYSGGMTGFMTDNDIMVHKNFSTLSNNRTGKTVLAANVFRPDQVTLGTVEMVFGVPPAPPSPPSPPPPPPPGPPPPPSLFLSLTPGTPLGNADPTLPQTETNYGPQALVAVLVPAGGSLAADWSFTLSVVDDTGITQTSGLIEFSSGAGSGTTVPIVAETITKFYSVTKATLNTGGSEGDQVFITQVVERQITL